MCVCVYSTVIYQIYSGFANFGHPGAPLGFRRRRGPRFGGHCTMVPRRLWEDLEIMDFPGFNGGLIGFNVMLLPILSWFNGI